MATLADSYTDLAGLRSACREAVGHVDQTVLLPDSMVDRAMQRALDKLNADSPVISVGTFTTVADQQAYTPLPATAFGFRRVYWSERCCCEEYQEAVEALAPVTGPVPGEVIDEFGTRVATEPSMATAILREQSWLRHLSLGGVGIVERTVYLDPIPASATPVIFTYHTARYASALTVANADRERFLTLVEHYLHTSLSVGAGAVTSVDDTNEGTSISTVAAQHHQRQAQVALRRYNRSRPPALPPHAFP